MDIPMDFDSKWDLSDVVLIAEDAEGNEKELHANKAYLATFSSVFKRMFFSSFKEANSESVKVSCTYEIMKLILQIIYEQSRDFLSVNQMRECSELVELYKTADYLDIPAIRKMCIYQMLSQPNIIMATAVLKVVSVGDALHDTLMEILQKMSSEDVKKFISIEDSQRVFSKKDVEVLYKIVTGTKISCKKQLFSYWRTPRNVADLSTTIDGSLLDCTQKFPRSDVLFKAKNSEGKELYSNKTVLSMVSTHFAEMFFSVETPSNSTEFSEIEVDVDYLVMKNILSIIHHSCNNGHLAKFLSTQLVLVYHMYHTAAKDNMNIPMVRNLCVKAMEERSSYFAWELAIRLEVDERSKVLENTSAEEALLWIHYYSDLSPSEYFSIIDDKKYRVEFSSKTKPILSLKEARVVIDKLVKHRQKKK